MLTILLNKTPIVENERDRYYSYANKYSNPALNEPIKNGHGMLCAKYKGPISSLDGEKPDLDNILLYNMRLATSGFSIVKLERELSNNDSVISYDYDICEADCETEQGIRFEIDTKDELSFTGPATVINFYNTFRGWITNKKNLPTYDNNSGLELVVEYNSRHSLSEGGLIKHSIDGIISALQRIDNIDWQILKRKGINHSERSFAVLNGSNAAYYNNDRNQDRIIWNPQDYLVERAIFMKNEKKDKGFFRVRIRTI